MKLAACITICLLGFLGINIEDVRRQFEEAKNSRETTETLYTSLQGYTKNDPVLLAYKGASLILRARLLPKQEDKRKAVVEGVALLDGAVRSAPKEVEIRLIRLAIQENAPKVIRYKKNMGEDKQMILSNFAAQPTAVKNLVRRYAQQSTLFTAEEQGKLGR
ncbi:hypothetical protein BC792_10839 [Sphingobacterium allocomposti]|jgi:hypothetical protein|uniref:Uncharacterized protein n=1 Tax=Sphingobacterium allocomposti TaxID=415956 RepID=A0A5S5DKR8_9SPHI|nr:hypothetical protein [Sphingobacterium composti Yoo et al. 2007 non Ten et al. 2007]TYP95948.1 hypothetical protein BC792_10839 [Sphingobacterium composti Yoo et al. 2007 non Ten et al. 2007]HLS96494.1 hypothetical protein [Sphingobacterium sp.]